MNQGLVQICGKESHGLLHNEHVDLFIKVLSSYQGLNPVTHKNKCGFVLITWKKGQAYSTVTVAPSESLIDGFPNFVQIAKEQYIYSVSKLEIYCPDLPPAPGEDREEQGGGGGAGDAAGGGQARG